MATFYTADFDLVRRDADGKMTPLLGETLTVREIGGSDITEVVSDEFGHVPIAEVGSDDPVEFYHATYPGTFTVTPASAAEDARAESNTFLIEDLFADANETVISDIYFEYPDLADVPRKLIGSIPPGGTLKYPIETLFAKTGRITKLDRDARGQAKTTDFNLADFEDVELSSAASESGLVLAIGSDIDGSTAQRPLYVDNDGKLAEFTLTAGQAVRKNAGNTALEAFMPGTVTTFSAGDLSPLFTTSESNTSTTPALSFSAISQSQNLFYASPNGSSGVPTFRAIVGPDLPTVPINKGGTNNTSFTSGRIPFFNGTSIVDDSNLVWQNTDKRLGVGIASPGYPLSLGTGLSSTKLAIYDGGSGNFYGIGAENSALCFSAGIASGATPQMQLHATSGYLSVGGLRFTGYTQSSANPTTTELPNNKDWGFHKELINGKIFLAYNLSGVILKVELT